MIVNVKSNEYELNVSRNEFNEKSHARLMKEVVKELYRDIANSDLGVATDGEREAIRQFALCDIDRV